MTTVHTIAVRTHGRYLVDAPARDPACPLLVGFHGYGETAELQLARLQAASSALVCERLAIQGLHRFYRGRTEQVVASWMTRQDRDAAIADNLAYVSAVISERTRAAPRRGLVCAGFSQGVAMAFRTACDRDDVTAVIALGGDVPPDVDEASLGRLTAAVIGRNREDSWYTEEKWIADAARLRAAGIAQVSSLAVAGGHDWTGEFSEAASRYLAGWWRR